MTDGALTFTSTRNTKHPGEIGGNSLLNIELPKVFDCVVTVEFEEKITTIDGTGLNDVDAVYTGAIFTINGANQPGIYYRKGAVRVGDAYDNSDTTLKCTCGTNDYPQRTIEDNISDGIKVKLTMDFINGVFYVECNGSKFMHGDHEAEFPLTATGLEYMRFSFQGHKDKMDLKYTVDNIKVVRHGDINDSVEVSAKIMSGDEEVTDLSAVANGTKLQAVADFECNSTIGKNVTMYFGVYSAEDELLQVVAARQSVVDEDNIKTLRANIYKPANAAYAKVFAWYDDMTNLFDGLIIANGSK